MSTNLGLYCGHSSGGAYRGLTNFGLAIHSVSSYNIEFNYQSIYNEGRFIYNSVCYVSHQLSFRRRALIRLQSCLADNDQNRSVERFSSGLIGYGQNIPAINNYNFVIVGEVMNFLSLNSLCHLPCPWFWRLSDSWLANQGYHYIYDNSAYVPSRIEKILRRIIQKYFKYISPSLIITPSHWLKDLILNSPHLSYKNVVQIPSPLDLSVFNVKKNYANGRIGVILPSTPRKGIHLFPELLRIASKKEYSEFQFNVCTPSFKALEKYRFPPNIKFYFANSPEQINFFYENIDSLISLSSMDNSPNLLLEAMVKGVMISSFSVNGIKELESSNLLKSCNYGDLEELVENASQLSLNRPNMQNLSAFRDSHSFDHIGSKLKDLIEIYK